MLNFLSYLHHVRLAASLKHSAKKYVTKFRKRNFCAMPQNILPEKRGHPERTERRRDRSQFLCSTFSAVLILFLWKCKRIFHTWIPVFKNITAGSSWTLVFLRVLISQLRCQPLACNTNTVVCLIRNSFKKTKSENTFWYKNHYIFCIPVFVFKMVQFDTDHIHIIQNSLNV